jgi:AAA family ATP:ADP antiporter
MVVLLLWKVASMIERFFRLMYGEISPGEVKKFTILAITFMFIIGTYWVLRPLKDGLFFPIVGGEIYEPWAKVLSMASLFIIIPLYSKLVDVLERHVLFYCITGGYAVIFATIAFLLTRPGIGLSNTVPSPYRLIGWVSYVAIETFGSITVALFWSFCTNITGPESAKRGFPFVVGGAQLGSLLGSVLAVNARSFGMPLLFLVSSFGMLCVGGMIAYFMYVMPPEMLTRGLDVSSQNVKKKTGFWEGLVLLLTRPYVFGIFLIVSFYEIVGTIIDYQMKVLASRMPEYASPEALTSFLGFFGICANGLALVMALLGTSYMMRRFGLTFCLLAFPVVISCVMLGMLCMKNITSSIEVLMWSSFAAMIVAKGLAYALGSPSKEMMYIPTSKDVQFKAKGFIDVAGARGAKGAGAMFNKTFLEGLSSANEMVKVSAIVSFAIIGVWLFVAQYIGRTFSRLTKSGNIIE